LIRIAVFWQIVQGHLKERVSLAGRLGLLLNEDDDHLGVLSVRVDETRQHALRGTNDKYEGENEVLIQKNSCTHFASPGAYLGGRSGKRRNKVANLDLGYSGEALLLL
jgi:hypothetical protein